MTDKEAKEHTDLICELFNTRSKLIDANHDVRMLIHQVEILQNFINGMLDSDLEFSEARGTYQEFFDDFFRTMKHGIISKSEENLP